MMNDPKPYIAVFGGSRLIEHCVEYREAYVIGKLLAQSGFNLVNGGGKGLMEASAKGTIDGGGTVLGAVVKDATWSTRNDFTHSVLESEDLISRIRQMYNIASGFIVLKGGTGTLAELAITWNLLSLQTEPRKPLILLGKDWFYLLDKVRDLLLITEDEEEAIVIVKKPDEAISLLLQLIPSHVK
jgi:uncharacterized protein (TIGR00730 family)